MFLSGQGNSLWLDTVVCVADCRAGGSKSRHDAWAHDHAQRQRHGARCGAAEAQR